VTLTPLHPTELSEVSGVILFMDAAEPA
jgi:hypothetical protein